MPEDTFASPSRLWECGCVEINRNGDMKTPFGSLQIAPNVVKWETNRFIGFPHSLQFELWEVMNEWMDQWDQHIKLTTLTLLLLWMYKYVYFRTRNCKDEQRTDPFTGAQVQNSASDHLKGFKCFVPRIQEPGPGMWRPVDRVDKRPPGCYYQSHHPYIHQPAISTTLLFL